MACPQSYHPALVLAHLDHLLCKHDENLRVQLSSNKVTCEEALSAVLERVAGLPVRTCLPTANSIVDPIEREARRREAIRQDALFLKALVDKQNSAIAEEKSIPLGLPIRSHAELKPTDMPKPITPEERAIIKKQALPRQMNLPPYPYPHSPPGKGKDGGLPDETDDVK